MSPGSLILICCSALIEEVLSETWVIAASTVLDIKCSTYVADTRNTDQFEWTADYAFQPMQKDHLQIPVKSKWRNIGKLRFTCTVEREGEVTKTGDFDVRFEPLRISRQGADTSENNGSYVLIIAGVLSALSIFCCTLLMVRNMRKTADALDPKLDAFAEGIAGYNLNRRRLGVQGKGMKYSVPVNRGDVVTPSQSLTLSDSMDNFSVGSGRTGFSSPAMGRESSQGSSSNVFTVT